jgi:hypothetical protein
LKVRILPRSHTEKHLLAIAGAFFMLCIYWL